MPLEGNQTRLEIHITERNMLPTSRRPPHTRTHSHVLDVGPSTYRNTFNS